jgi:hypothetical protein
VFRPLVAARIEQASDSTGAVINSSDVGALEAVAVVTAQANVVGSARAAVLSRNHMIELMRQRGRALGQVTILATISRALPYSST